jgi:hypothetical protein
LGFLNADRSSSFEYFVNQTFEKANLVALQVRMAYIPITMEGTVAVEDHNYKPNDWQFRKLYDGVWEILAQDFRLLRAPSLQDEGT